ncbi:MAG: DNA-directed RNA polymerase subunit omega [bacterium JZ-2024 1]
MKNPHIDEILGKGKRGPAYPNLERLLKIIPNRYILVNVISQRARDILIWKRCRDFRLDEEYMEEQGEYSPAEWKRRQEECEKAQHIPPPQVECDIDNEDPIDVAIAELLAGKLTYEMTSKTYRDLLMEEDQAKWVEISIEEEEER